MLQTIPDDLSYLELNLEHTALDWNNQTMNFVYEFFCNLNYLMS